MAYDCWVRVDGLLLAMPKVASDLVLLESSESKPSNSNISKIESFAFQLEEHVCIKPGADLKVCSGVMLRSPSWHQDQQENVPLKLTNLPPVSQPDSNSSVDDSDDCSTYCDSGSLENSKFRCPEPLIFNIHFEDHTYVKQLDYSIFSRWESIEALLVSFEGDGAVIDELWDVREDMPIGSGDWNARVYPGLEVDVTCWKAGDWEDDPSEFDSGAKAESEEEQSLLWDGAQHHGKRWWFGRWRMKVEQEAMGAGGAVHEPPLRTILLGVLAMATFLSIVFGFCAV
jgi:hypothetical protein